MNTDALIAVVAAVLSGGILTGWASLHNARKKAPAERDMVIVQGAQTAVLSLERTLRAETRRADRAEAERDEGLRRLAEKDERIASLEAKLDELQALLDAAREELHQIIMSTRGEGDDG